MNRRRFLGTAAGAAAAPALAGDLRGADLLATRPGALVGYGKDECAAPVPEVSANYIARLRRAASGELSDWDKERIEERRREAHADAALSNLDALRSVSAPVKRLMLADHYERQLRADFVRNAMRELSSAMRRG
jgi:Arc/MetJ-type ribon-helix-helix transcriptional regulator